MSFRRKLTAFVVLLILLMQALNLFLVDREIRRRVASEARSEFAVARAVFESLLSNRTRQASRMAAISTSDFSLKQVLAGPDIPTKSSALRSIQGRTDADWIAFVALDGRTETGLAAPFPGDAAFPFPALLEAAELSASATASGLGRMGDRLALIVVTAVDAPRTLGYVVAGYRVDGAFLAELGRNLPFGLLATILVQDTGPPLAVSQLSPPVLADVAAALEAEPIGPDRQREGRFGGEAYLMAAEAVPAADPSIDGLILFHYSLDRALAASRGLLYTLYAIFGVSLVLAALGALSLSRSLGRPIRALSDLAEEVQEGRYDAVPDGIDRRDEFGRLTQSFATMVRRVKEREERLSYLARFDTVTGLPNRMAFLKDVAPIPSEPAHLMGIVEIASLPDLDYAFGRPVRDRVIQSLAGRLRRSLGPTEGLARIGDGAFAFFSPVPEAGPPALAQRMLAPFEQAIDFEDWALDVRARVGLAPAEPGEDPARLLHRAEAALFRARIEQLGCVLYDPSVDAPNPDRLTLMSEMRKGLETRQFHLVFQPKLDLQARGIGQAEALVRWRHPERGPVRPDQFIPLAEQTGRISLVTDWVIQEAIDTLAHWRRSGLAMRLGVNLSARDLYDRGLPDRVSAWLAQAGLKAADLAFELTESSLMADQKTALAVLEEMHGRGHSLAVDDFGTGYSSLQYLQKLPVSEIKIDRTFVHKLAQSGGDRAITAATINLAHKLGCKATAEGVEDQRSLDILADMGCDTAQGYFIAKPLPAPDLEQFVGHAYAARI